MGKIDRPKTPRPKTKSIPTQTPPPFSEVVFGFKYLETTAKFRCQHRDGQYTHKLLERLKALSFMRMQELTGNHTRALRCHPIDWADTTEPAGFTSLPTQLRDMTPLQFEVSQEAHGRVHGFVLQNVFQVVWVDPDHELYKGK